MIVDTSALIAVLMREDGWLDLANALRRERGRIAAPAVLEFLSVARGPRFRAGDGATTFLDGIVALGHEIVSWTPEHARTADEAQRDYGKGNGSGGILNLVDLMVYAVARIEDAPLLFTGRDFLTTDVRVHPASRV